MVVMIMLVLVLVLLLVLTPPPQMHGIPGPGQGTGVSNVSWRMGLQKLQWTIGLPGGGMRDGMLRLNSTVYVGNL